MSNVALVFPPASSPFSPPMPLIALRAYLEANGVAVTAIDANIDAAHHVLNPQRCRSLVEPYLGGLKGRQLEQLKQAVEIKRRLGWTSPPPALDEARAHEVLDRLETLWTEEGFNLPPESFRTDLATLNDALILASLLMIPNSLTVWGQAPGPVNRQSHNPYLAYCRDVLAPRLAELSPSVIGISLSFPQQQIYTGHLIHHLRAQGVGATIVLGGAFFTEVCRTVAPVGGERVSPGDETSQVAAFGDIQGFLMGVDPLTGQVASIPEATTIGVCGEGEKPFLTICRRAREGASVLDVPRVVYLESGGQTQVYNPKDEPLSETEIPATDLAGLGVGVKYMTPIPVAPLMTSRGCYWNKCAFCGRSKSIDSTYRVIPIDVIMETVETYHRDYGVELMMYCDESMPPAVLRRLTDRLEEAGLAVDYSAMLRFEEGLIPLIERASRQGLRYVAFGLESACPRVLERMNKGIEPGVAERLLDECHRQGVRAHVFAIFGFPSETAEEADVTLAFLERVADKVFSVGVTPFYLDEGSYIMTHPDEFGIEPKPGKRLGFDPSTFTIREGLNAQQANAYIARVAAHPTLGRLRPVNGREDYWGIVDTLKTRGLWEDPDAATE